MKVRIYDLSLGGCLIEASLPLQIGRRITLRLELPGEESLSLEGETVRVQEPSKYAVKFLDLDEAKQSQLQQMIERLVATSPAGSTLEGAADV